jgi:succinate dehydrogenase/fumarate reductase cytochrome b subunit
MLRKILLGSGVASSVLYVVSDILISWWDPNYSYRDQSFSELLAPRSPTRPIMVVANGVTYGVLVTAFGVGVWKAAGGRRTGRITGALLAGYAVTGAVTGVFLSAPTRETLEAGEETWRNILHLPATAVSVLSILLAIGFGSTLLGRRFRYYSYATILAIVVFGVWAGIQIGQMGENQPTPWLGIVERISVYAIMLWVAVLAIGLLRAPQSEGQ